MSYAAWFYAHGTKHAALIAKLTAQGLDDASIIAYFRFDHLMQAEPDFCPLFATQTPCHTMKQLNCYWCACPHFRFDDAGIAHMEGATVYSTCAIDAKEGKQVRFGDTIHQDCTGCTIPHKVAMIKKTFDLEWLKAMGKCDLATQKGETQLGQSGLQKGARKL